MDALERAIKRMRAAGYGQPDQQDWARSGRFELPASHLERMKATNNIDDVIRDTLRREYKIMLTDDELLEFSNFLVALDPTYPSWSEQDYIKDGARVNSAGMPIWVHVMKKPERFYQAYLEFKKMKR